MIFADEPALTVTLTVEVKQIHPRYTHKCGRVDRRQPVVHQTSRPEFGSAFPCRDIESKRYLGFCEEWQVLHLFARNGVQIEDLANHRHLRNPHFGYAKSGGL